MSNDTETLTLTGFLLARIAEDEAVARAASPGRWEYGDVASIAGGSLYGASRMIGSMHYEQPDDHDGSIVRHLLSTEADANGAHIARHDPARVLAECKAKRGIVRDATSRNADLLAEDELTLLRLVSVYADHPDFNPDWA